MSEIMLIEPLSGLEKSKAEQIEAVFIPMIKDLKAFEGAYDEVMGQDITKESCAEAKRLRLAIAKIRIAGDKVHKELKAEALRTGRAIDGVRNILKFAVEEKEGKLKERETHYERMEEERKAALHNDRLAELQKYDFDGSVMNLGEMDEMVWKNFLAGTRTNWQAQKDAERKTEEDLQAQIQKQSDYDNRLKALLIYGDFFDTSKLTIESTEDDFEQIIADAKTGRTAHLAEQERIRKENERLQKEAEAAEAKRIKDEKSRKAREKKEQEAREAEQKAKDEEIRKEREATAAREKAAQEKAEAERLAQEEQLREEREAREAVEEESRLQREEHARKDAEAEAARKAETEAAAAAEKKAALAPDKEKLETVAGNIMAKLNMFSSNEAVMAMRQASKILKDAAEKM